MSSPDDTTGWDEGTPDRLYAALAGYGETEDDLDLVTLIVARSSTSTPGLVPEQTAILQLCPNPLSIAELAAELHTPASAITVWVAALLDAGHVEARAPAVTASTAPDLHLLETLIDGLQRL
jgi:hypothetical protein